MPEDQPRTNPEQGMLNAIEILSAIQKCKRFQIDTAYKSGSRIELLSGPEWEHKKYYPTEDFLKAVDYYYENRDSEFSVNMAMQNPDGVVNVWTPNMGPDVDRRVVVSIKNYMVPQILEFAYLIVRARQKEAQAAIK